MLHLKSRDQLERLREGGFYERSLLLREWYHHCTNSASPILHSSSPEPPGVAAISCSSCSGKCEGLPGKESSEGGASGSEHSSTRCGADTRPPSFKKNNQKVFRRIKHKKDPGCDYSNDSDGCAISKTLGRKRTRHC